MGRLLELALLALAPGAAQPGWCREAGIEQGDYRQAGQREPNLDRRLLRQRGGEDGGQQDGDDRQIGQAQRPHAGPLDDGSPPGVQPEADAGLPDASAPDHDERHQGGELERFGRVSPVYELEGDQKQSGEGHRPQHQASGPWPQGNHAVAEKQQGQP